MPQIRKQTLQIGGMSCSACSASVEKAVGRMEGVESISVDLLSGRALCTYDAGKTDVGAICETVEKIGFTASVPPEKDKTEKAPAPAAKEGFSLKTRLIVSFSCLIPLMFFSMGHMLNIPFLSFLHDAALIPACSLAQFLLALPVLIVNGGYFTGGFKKLFHGAPNMDTLVAVGSAASFLYGVVALYRVVLFASAGEAALLKEASHSLFFESAAMIPAIVTVGKALEARAKRRSGDAVESLLDLSPKTATVVREGKEVLIPASGIEVGDILLIRPGDVLPVDGTVVEGQSAFDLSSLTGESLPVEKGPGDKVVSSSGNLTGVVRVRAERVGSETTLSQIAELVRAAASSKAPVSRMADKVSAIFVPVVMGLSLLTLAVWLILGAPAGKALNYAVSVLVISCPCALGLATPVAVTIAMGKAARGGVLFKSAEELEKTGSVDVAVFDKTGTLTEGKMRVSSLFPLKNEEELCRLAFSLEADSGHPVGEAVCAFCREKGIEPLERKDFSATFGRGVSAKIGGRPAYGGNAAWMRENGIDLSFAGEKASEWEEKGLTVLYFAFDGVCAGLIALADEPRAGASEAIAALSGLKVGSVMLTGDSEKTGRRVASSLGVSSFKAGCLPADKAGYIASLKKEGKKVLMVGDGVNDAPPLSEADVGMAVGGGTDIASEAAGVVLMGDSPMLVPESVAFSRRVLRNIRVSLFWAFFYNCLGIPVAAGVFSSFGLSLSPMVASAAMSFSSLFVVTNALRLLRGKDFGRKEGREEGGEK